MTLTKEESLAVLKAIKTRRSIRKYKSTPVPQELIDQVIEAGTYAASGKSHFTICIRYRNNALYTSML